MEFTQLVAANSGLDPYEDEFHWLHPRNWEPNPKEPGRILIEIVPGGSPNSDWKNFSIEEMQGMGGAYEYESAYGDLDYALRAYISESEIGLGWWVIENFTLSFTGDGYYTDFDVDYDFSDPRPATWKDIEDFGLGAAPFMFRILSRVMWGKDWKLKPLTLRKLA